MQAHAEKVEQERRRKDNFQSWLTPNSQRREGPVVQMSVRKTFKTKRCWRRKTLTYENTAGELIDQLIGICFAEPPYLRKADAVRYVSLLNELKAFECLSFPPQGSQDPSKQYSDTTFAGRIWNRGSTLILQRHTSQ